MKNKLYIIVLFSLILLCVASFSATAIVRRFHGVVKIDGQGTGNITILVENIDQTIEVTCETFENGTYECFLDGAAGNLITVSADEEDLNIHDSVSFKLKSGVIEIETNFNFELSVLTIITNQIVNLLFGLDVNSFYFRLFLTTMSTFFIVSLLLRRQQSFFTRINKDK